MKMTGAMLGAALLIGSAVSAMAEDRPSNITVGAASVGGTYYVSATGIAQVLTEKMGISSNVEVTGGPLQNIQLVNAGQMTLGYTTAAPAFEARGGTGWAEGVEHPKIRALVPLYPSYFHWWSKKASEINDIRDLNGKVVALGPIGGTPDTYGRRLFDALGIKPSRIVNAGFSDITNMMRDGLVEAALTTSGLPHPAVMDSQSSGPISIVGVPPQDVDTFKSTNPAFSKGVIPETVYENMDGPEQTMTLWNFVIANESMDDDLAYEITKTIFENVDSLIAVHRSSVDIRPENAEHITIPLHPGAVRYYDEKGISIPTNLRP